jgi:hypothetical protein
VNRFGLTNGREESNSPISPLKIASKKSSKGKMFEL